MQTLKRVIISEEPFGTYLYHIKNKNQRTDNRNALMYGLTLYKIIEAYHIIHQLQVGFDGLLGRRGKVCMVYLLNFKGEIISYKVE